MAREDQLSQKQTMKESRKKWGKRYGQSWLGDAPDKEKASTKSAPKTAKAVRSSKSSSSAPSKSKRPKDSYTAKLSSRVESALTDDRASGGPRRGRKKTSTSSGPTSRPNNKPSTPKVESVNAGASKAPNGSETQGKRIRDGIRNVVRGIHKWGQSDTPVKDIHEWGKSDDPFGRKKIKLKKEGL